MLWNLLFLSLLWSHTDSHRLTLRISRLIILSQLLLHHAGLCKILIDLISWLQFLWRATNITDHSWFALNCPSIWYRVVGAIERSFLWHLLVIKRAFYIRSKDLLSRVGRQLLLLKSIRRKLSTEPILVVHDHLKSLFCMSFNPTGLFSESLLSMFIAKLKINLFCHII